MENQQPCVWATSKDLWDSFLNDPELARALDIARNIESEQDKQAEKADAEAAGIAVSDGETEQRIGARLRAYETPITDEILRQSIR